MSQLENTQTVVLQQTDGKKIYLDLNVSTDTTAIWSFWLAMIIALILGASATLIAVWYGRKSFKLTEMSFDTVVEQIKSSEKLSLNSNSELIQSQNKLKTMELRYLYKSNEIDELRNLVTDYFTVAASFNNDVALSISLLHDNQFGELGLEKTEIVELIDKINSYSKQIFSSCFKIECYLNEDDDSLHKDIILNMGEVNSCVWSVVGALSNSKSQALESIVQFSCVFDKTKENIIRLIREDIKIHRGD